MRNREPVVRSGKKPVTARLPGAAPPEFPAHQGETSPQFLISVAFSENRKRFKGKKKGQKGNDEQEWAGARTVSERRKGGGDLVYTERGDIVSSILKQSCSRSRNKEKDKKSRSAKSGWLPSRRCRNARQRSGGRVVADL